jgi:hypothetical protein
MRNVALAVVLCVGITGCGDGVHTGRMPTLPMDTNPLMTRFSPGDEAIITADMDASAVMVRSKMAKGPFGPTIASLPVGTRLRVVAEAETGEIQALVLEGEEAMTPVWVESRWLRAISAR